MHGQTLPALLHLVQVIEQKAAEVHPFIKTGRTHLMDAMPVRMGQVLNGWAQQLKANIGHLQDLLPACRPWPRAAPPSALGSMHTPEFAARFSQQLSSLTDSEIHAGQKSICADWLPRHRRRGFRTVEGRCRIADENRQRPALDELRPLGRLG